MKKILLIIFLILTAFGFLFGWKSYIFERIIAYFRAPVQGKKWQGEVDKFRHLYPAEGADCFFVGDSHVEQCEWQELFSSKRCANRGIGGETTAGLLLRLSSLPKEGKGRFIFLQIGVNDLVFGEPVNAAASRYGQILDELLMRGYRVVPTLVFFVRYLDKVNTRIPELNEEIIRLAKLKKLSWINLNPQIAPDKRLSEKYSTDGVHLNHQGYLLWIKEIRSFLEPS